MATSLPEPNEILVGRPEPDDRLDSWKEIAAYLKRDVRTVRRWERSGGLPVHRHLHQRQASVFAYRSELDAWWQNEHKEPEQAETAAVELASPQWWKSALLVVAAVVILAGGITWWLLSSRPALSFATRNWVLVADFENGTGDPRFDRALVAPLNISLAQSQRLNVFPRSRVAETLKRMGKPLNSHIDETLGREICQRENIRALVLGTLARTGSRYELTAEIVDPETADVAASYVQRTNSEDDLLNALDSVATQLRQGLENRSGPSAKAAGRCPSFQRLRSMPSSSTPMPRISGAWDCIRTRCELTSRPCASIRTLPWRMRLWALR